MYLERIPDVLGYGVLLTMLMDIDDKAERRLTAGTDQPPLSIL